MMVLVRVQAASIFVKPVSDYSSVLFRSYTYHHRDRVIRAGKKTNVLQSILLFTFCNSSATDTRSNDSRFLEDYGCLS